MSKPVTTADVMVLGGRRTGKQRLIQCFAERNSAQEPQFVLLTQYSVRMSLNSRDICLRIWFSSGIDRFQRVSRQFIQSCKGVIVTYSLSDRESFSKVPYLVRKIRSETTHLPIVLVGTKLDLAYCREVSYCEGAKVAEGLKVPFLETSAKDGTNVEQLFGLFAVLVGRELGLPARLGVGKVGRLAF